MKDTAIPAPFFWRRLHSLMGLLIVIFLIEHLLTNSQAALFFGEDGNGFVKAVNKIHNMPYLPLIEITIIGLPILIHALWGMHYLMTASYNSISSDGTRPSLPEYPRNHAYTWQRITSWILLFAIAAHVIQMRFIEYPASATRAGETHYMVRLDLDKGLHTLADRLNVELYNRDQIRIEKEGVKNIKLPVSSRMRAFFYSTTGLFKPESSDETHPQKLLENQEQHLQKKWARALEKKPLAEGQVIAVAPDFGTAELLIVRETFKMPSMILLYSIFVIAAAFHAFNGLWTFLITWGVALTERSQRLMRKVTTFLMVMIASMGLIAIWGTYWINLRS